MPRPSITRRSFLASTAATAIAARALGVEPGARESSERSLAAAADYLWRQQSSDDGGWHSAQYGVLRSGHALTPFVLHALLQIPISIAPRDSTRVRAALDFLRERIDDEGVLGRSDPDLLEYPIYSTSYALRCLLAVQDDPAFRHERDGVLVELMLLFLMTAQFDVDMGFTPESPAFGGWGFNEARGPGDSGHMDLAHTRRALQALREARDGFKKAENFDCNHAFKQATSFLLVVQKHPRAAARPHHASDGPARSAPPPLFFDGGFYFSPIVLDANKGRRDEHPAPHWRSYATATCDGVLALLAAGVPRDDERVTAAEAWLRQHTNLDYPQGVPTEYPEPWGDAIRFYHYAVRGEAYRALEWPAAERLRLAELVQSRQEADGSFVNRSSPLMKEDDPVLCTTLATAALANCL
jgi:squalene-hopene/tetraprenyl-beta-curcumene cyclase